MLSVFASFLQCCDRSCRPHFQAQAEESLQETSRKQSLSIPGPSLNVAPRHFQRASLYYRKSVATGSFQEVSFNLCQAQLEKSLQKASRIQVWSIHSRKSVPGSVQELVLKHLQAQAEKLLQDPSRMQFLRFPSPRWTLAPGHSNKFCCYLLCLYSVPIASIAICIIPTMSLKILSQFAMVPQCSVRRYCYLHHSRSVWSILSLLLCLYNVLIDSEAICYASAMFQ